MSKIFWNLIRAVQVVGIIGFFYPVFMSKAIETVDDRLGVLTVMIFCLGLIMIPAAVEISWVKRDKN